MIYLRQLVVVLAKASIDHFTVLGLVPLSVGEAEVDLVLIQTSFPFLMKILDNIKITHD